MILSSSLMPFVSITRSSSVGPEGALFDEIVLADDYLPNWLEPSAVAITRPNLRPARIRSKTHRKSDRSLDAIAAGEAGGGEGFAVQGAAGPAIGCAQAEFGTETLRGKRRVEA